MEKLNMAIVSSSSSSRLVVMGNPTSLQNPTHASLSFSTALPFLRLRPMSLSSRFPVSPKCPRYVIAKLGAHRLASVSSSTGKQTSSVGVNPLPVPPPSSPSNIGSPLFWIGVGVGLSALFSWVATNLKNYAMQQAFKTMMNQMNTQNNQFKNSGFSPGSPFPFPTPSAPGFSSTPSDPTPITSSSSFVTSSTAEPVTSPSPAASQPAVTVDVSATNVESRPVTDVNNGKEIKEEPKKYAFVDVAPEETLLKSPFERVEDTAQTSSSNGSQFAGEASQNGAASKQGPTTFPGSQSTGPVLSVEALETMLEDPTVQKIVYPYLPEEMRNPTTFKWMLQNPQYRQQLQDMLNNMKGSGEWDNRMMESLKNFDLNSPEVKQQFDQIGLTPEEVIKKIMANPDVAMAFQNPRVQQAIMDCSQNPLSIAKYQNDKEVMDVFNKISELFPGAGGSP
ncbi:hypothetical protein K2173_001266 [Erythroxylum novogranatense]|uniref:Protein TIC 40, chloroplastic n=1 Tax=Erythroxylum novogranatense TaxID=1862640 RepID=A0AAV8T4N2_9ROSI|nr:hypothetical protein K2173_001266 [Erythroxylum novogranatense]